MAGLLDDNIFSNMSTWDKIKTLASGYGLGALNKVTNYDAINKHGEYPDLLRGELQNNYPELGYSRQNRTPLDAAINYGGGYDFGKNIPVSYQDADKMAKAYQLTDYLTSSLMSNKQGMSDASKDYYDNMAGVRQAIEDKRLKKSADSNKIIDMSALYGKRNSTMPAKY